MCMFVYISDISFKNYKEFYKVLKRNVQSYTNTHMYVCVCVYIPRF